MAVGLSVPDTQRFMFWGRFSSTVDHS